MSAIHQPKVGDTTVIQNPFDRHVHFRDAEMLDVVVPHTANIYSGAIIMPNIGGKGKPHVYGCKEAVGYHDRIRRALDKCGRSEFFVGLTIYLTEDTDPDEIAKAAEQGLVCAVKLYPANATTNSAEGVSDVRKCFPVLALMQDMGIPLLIHGELPDFKNRDILLWEADFMGYVLPMIADEFPNLRISLEHISTGYSVGSMHSLGDRVQATATPQHMVYSMNDMLANGVKPDLFCKPIPKGISDVIAVRSAALNIPVVRLGTDSAPHRSGDKYCACGCAGCFTPHSLGIYANIFQEHFTWGINTPIGKNNFQRFVGGGVDFYTNINTKIVLPKRTITLRWVDSIPQHPDVPVGGEEVITPLPDPFVGKPGWVIDNIDY